MKFDQAVYRCLPYQMQKCMNEDAKRLYKDFTKRPWIPAILILIIVSGISMFTVSLLCKIHFPCTDDQQNYSLFFGLITCICTTVFIIIPCLIRYSMNCIWYQEAQPPVIRNYPLSSTTKIRPPNSPIPTHALKSFREFHSDEPTIT